MSLLIIFVIFIVWALVGLAVSKNTKKNTIQPTQAKIVEPSVEQSQMIKQSIERSMNRLEKRFIGEAQQYIEQVQFNEHEDIILYNASLLRDTIDYWVSLQSTNEQALKYKSELPKIIDLANARVLKIKTDSLFKKAKLTKSVAIKQKYAKQAIALILETKPNICLEQEMLNEQVDLLQQFAAQVEIDDYMQRAKRSEFKGENKKALSLYKDALFSALNDEVPDEKQQKIIEELNIKIMELKPIVDA